MGSAQVNFKCQRCIDERDVLEVSSLAMFTSESSSAGNITFQLFEQQKTENDRLKKDVQRLQTDLSESKLDLEKSRMRNESVKSYDTSLDKRVRYS